MSLDKVKEHGLVLLGCGKMGSAMLEGWLERGVPASAVSVIEPKPSDWLTQQGVRLNTDLPKAPAVAILAVKPQMMGAALPALKALGGGGTLFISIAAGTPIARFEEAFGAGTPIVRAMPNTPAAIGQGITGITGNAAASRDHLDLAEALLRAVGEVVQVEGEDAIDAVTGVSGSGPAYVFHLIEAMAAGGEAQGLSPEVALQLARATVAGAAALAQQTGEDPAQLRKNVTSPGGTTAAALEVLMDDTRGFPALLPKAIDAAVKRAKELAND